MGANGQDGGLGRPTRHGRYSLMRGLSRACRRTTIDPRTTVGRALAARRGDLLADLGGIEGVSTQELVLVEEAVKTKLIIDSVDAWLLSQPTLVNKRNRSVLPVARDRQALPPAVARHSLISNGVRKREAYISASSRLTRSTTL
jgi:hypothetical protein